MPYSTPVILHGVWSDNVFCVWAESSAGVLDTPESVLAKLDISPGDHQRLNLTLPGCKGIPAPSSTLLDRPPTPGRISLQTCTIATTALPLDTAVDLLLQIRRLDPAKHSDIFPGPDLDYWAFVLEWSAAFLIRQDVVPDITREEKNIRGCWRPWFRPEESTDFATLASTMPPACLAIHERKIFRDQEKVRDAAGQLLYSVTCMLVDELCRKSVTASGVSVDPLQSVHDRWLAELCGLVSGENQTLDSSLDDLGLPPRVQVTLTRAGIRTIRDLVSCSAEELLLLPGFGPASLNHVQTVLARIGLHLDTMIESAARELNDLADQLPAWHSRLQPQTWDGLRLCLRLEEPASEGAPWILRFLLQATDDPSLLVPADELWEGNGELFPGRRLDRPDESLLSALDRAAQLFPPLAPALGATQPSCCHLSSEETYQFLQEGSWLLEDEGFGILLPSWWTGRRQGITARAAISTPDEDAPAGLGDILSFDWQMALGDTPITYEDLRQLAAAKTPLVQIRGQWVEVRPDEIDQALRFWQKRNRLSMTVGTAIALGLGDERTIHGMRFTGVDAQGWLARVIEGLKSGEKLPVIAPPNTLSGQLRPYQQRGLSWLHFLSRFGLGGCLADDMGLGKTIQALALILKNREQGQTEPVLLICPTSVLGNWQREAARFAPDLAVLLHHGSGRSREKAFEENAARHHLVLTSFGLAFRDVQTLHQVSWGGLIVDEAHNIKNPDTRQSRAIRSIPARFRIALTGTPVENSLMDLWSIMNFCNPGFLGTRSSFRKKYLAPVQIRQDKKTADRLRRITRPFLLRRLKTDKQIIRDLPEKQETDIPVTLTPEQASLYQAVVSEADRELAMASGMQRRGVILATLMKLKQICNHPAHFLGQKRPLAGRSGKLDRLLEMMRILRDADDSALVFTQFREMGDLLTPYLRTGLGIPVYFLHGGVSRKKRDVMVREFQDGAGTAIMVLSLKAGGTGLNLTRASHVFHFDRWWNPAVEDQATDRAFRIGQKKNVQVHKFLCQGTVEERIDQLLKKKKDLAQQVIGSGEAWLTELSTRELRELFRLGNEAVES
ncbi:SNF2-related protein [Desulfolithobacter sp.]